MDNVLVGPVFVMGLPAPFASESREREWKEKIAETMGTAWAGRPFIESPCEVTLLFRLPLVKAEETDIDNLLKPAIDAIGSVLFRPARRGHQVRWNADDNWIYRLTAEKVAEAIDSRVGMEVTVADFPIG